MTPDTKPTRTATTTARRQAIAFRLNGRPERVIVDPLRPLAAVVRDEFALTGTKLGCEAGDCGACSVLVDDVAVDSCLFPVAHAGGCEVVTIEGLAELPVGQALHRAFRKHNASQCGFCIPGILVAVAELAERDEPITRSDVIHGLAGNLCRCTGYESIVAAVLDAHRELRPDTAGGDDE